MALCRLLLSAPDMLLLDEPTNHLDAESVAWLERYLEEYPSTVIAVTHDRYFLDNVARVDPRARSRPRHPLAGQLLLVARAEGAAPGARGARARGAAPRRSQHELEWVRQNPKARQAKSKARLQRYEELASQEFQERNETNEIYIPPGERLGELVIEVHGLRKGYGDRLLIDNLELHAAARRHRRHHRPERCGQDHAVPHAHRHREPDAGEIRVGPSVQASPTSTSRARRSMTRRPCGRRSPAAST